MPVTERSLSEAEYHAIDAVSASALRTLATLTPRHLTWRKANERRTPAMLLGSALHCAVLEPERFPKAWHAAPECDRRTKEGKALYAAAQEKAAQDGATVIPAEDHESCLGMADSLLRHPDCSMWLRLCQRREVSLVGEMDGLPVKARIDALGVDGRDAFFLDIKSIGRPATLRAVQSECVERGYFLQFCWYRRMLREAGYFVDGCAVLWVESDAPWCARALPVSVTALDECEPQVDAALGAWREWMRDPERDWRDGDSELSLPRWAVGGVK